VNPFNGIERTAKAEEIRKAEEELYHGNPFNGIERRK